MYDEIKPIKETEILNEIAERTKTVLKSPTFEAPVPLENIQPSNKIRGWHFMKPFVDKDHNVFEKGKFIGNDPSKKPSESKKA